MTAGPENLYQRGRVWWVRYYAGGKLVRRSLHTESLREAKRLRNEIVGGRDVGAHVRAKFGLVAAQDAGAPVPTFGEVAERYLKHRAGTSKAGKTHLTLERQRVENWLIPHFGARRITDIGHDDVAMFMGELREAQDKRGSDDFERTIGAGQIHKVFQVLNRIYRFALRRKLATLNPADLERDERPSPPPPRVLRLTDNEAGQLLARVGAESQLGRMVWLALETGLRWGEVNGLAWEDLDLDGDTPTYTVRRSYDGPPKNKAAAVTTELMPSIAAALRTWRELVTGRWVFPGRAGELRTRMPDSHRERIFTAATAAGIDKHITPHVFRHTFGSRIYEQTRDVKATQRLMRHSDVTTTLRVYVHDERPLGEVVASIAPIKVGTLLKAV